MRNLKSVHYIVTLFVIAGLLSSCASFNTQAGALAGAGLGIAADQLFGGKNSKSSLKAAGWGAAGGALLGNMVDQTNVQMRLDKLEHQQQKQQVDMTNPYEAAEAGRRAGVVAGKKRAARHNYDLSEKRAAEETFFRYKIE